MTIKWGSWQGNEMRSSCGRFIITRVKTELPCRRTYYRLSRDGKTEPCTVDTLSEAKEDAEEDE